MIYHFFKHICEDNLDMYGDVPTIEARTAFDWAYACCPVMALRLAALAEGC